MIRLKGIKFPVIADIDGELSRSFGVLNISSGCSARALAVLDPQFNLVHLAVNNEQTFSSPHNTSKLIRRLQVHKQ